MLHVAPMAAVTDRHFRMLIRCVSPLPTLWSEMTWDTVAIETVDAEALMGFSAAERPVVLQLGGSQPERLARAAALAVSRGYQHINLNCGCPAGTNEWRACYGARLMLDPRLVATPSRWARRRRPSVKCRLGVDGRDSYDGLVEFVRLVSGEGGVRVFIVHARVALLTLNAAANRTVPPLDHERVLRLAAAFPHLTFIINGGVTSLEQAAALIARGVRGAMIGRQSVTEPYLFARSAVLSGGGGAARSRREALDLYLTYASEAQAANWGGGHPVTLARALLAPISGLFHATESGSRWRRAVRAAMQERGRLRDCPIADSGGRAARRPPCGGTAALAARRTVARRGRK
uniref:tRNA-dihydrouridine synthase n=1 Tax=Emiliania huxleyi (strain CCMP1516) TaxID=280463 RepID=A0A0D3KEJ2_EMIH1